MNMRHIARCQFPSSIVSTHLIPLTQTKNGISFLVQIINSNTTPSASNERLDLTVRYLHGDIRKSHEISG